MTEVATGDIPLNWDVFVPLLYQQFAATPSTQPAFFRLNQDLPSTVRVRTEILPQLNAFRRPVRIIFGASDPYLNASVGNAFTNRFQRLSSSWCQVRITMCR